MLFPYTGFARKGGGGGVKACQDGLGHFFSPRLPGGVRACQDGFGHFFSTFARLTEEGRGGGGGLKLFGQYPYRTNTFQKGSSLSCQTKNGLLQR